MLKTNHKLAAEAHTEATEAVAEANGPLDLDFLYPLPNELE